MDPEQLMELGLIDDQKSDLHKQIAQARALRNVRGPQDGRQVGRVYVASSPLEHIGALAHNVVGRVNENRAREQLDAMRKKQIQGRAGFAKALAGPPGGQEMPFGMGGGMRMGGGMMAQPEPQTQASEQMPMGPPGMDLSEPEGDGFPVAPPNPLEGVEIAPPSMGDIAAKMGQGGQPTNPLEGMSAISPDAILAALRKGKRAR